MKIILLLEGKIHMIFNNKKCKYSKKCIVHIHSTPFTCLKLNKS